MKMTPMGPIHRFSLPWNPQLRNSIVRSWRSTGSGSIWKLIEWQCQGGTQTPLRHSGPWPVIIGCFFDSWSDTPGAADSRTPLGLPHSHHAMLYGAGHERSVAWQAAGRHVRSICGISLGSPSCNVQFTHHGVCHSLPSRRCGTRFSHSFYLLVAPERPRTAAFLFLFSWHSSNVGGENLHIFHRNMVYGLVTFPLAARIRE